MKKKSVITIFVTVLLVLLVVILVVINRQEGQAASVSSRKQSVRISDSLQKSSSISISKWHESISTRQSVANAEYRSSRAEKSSLAKKKETQSKTELSNKIDFSKLSELDKAKAAIFYGIGNAEYFVRDGDFDVSKNAYAQGLRVSSLDIHASFGPVNVVVPSSSPTVAGAPVFVYVELGPINAAGDRAQGVTYGKIDYPNSHSGDLVFDNDPNESNWGVGVSYQQISDWVNQHGGKKSINKIVISNFSANTN